MRGMFVTLAALAIAAPAAAQDKRFERPYWLDQSVIEARGRSEVEFAPNRASFQVSYVEVGRTAAEASQAAAERAKLAAEALKAVAKDAVRTAANLTLEPIYETYRDGDGQRIPYNTPDRIERYAARVSVNVTVTELDKASAARAALLALGPENAGAIRYRLEPTGEQMRQVFEAAAKDAAERAKITASALGARLGAMLVFQEGEGPCLGQWYTPSGRDDGYAGYPPPPPPPPAPAMAMAEVARGRVGGKEVAITADDIARLSLPSDPEPVRLQGAVCAVYAVGG